MPNFTIADKGEEARQESLLKIFPHI
jgi:hypothetical protein